MNAKLGKYVSNLTDMITPMLAVYITIFSYYILFIICIHIFNETSRADLTRKLYEHVGTITSYTVAKKAKIESVREKKCNIF